MAEMMGEEPLLHINPGRLIPLRATGSAGSGEETAARLQTSSAVLELGKKLLQAAREGDTAVVLHLMSKGAPFTTDWLGTSPLHLAAMNAHVETCRVLLRAGISRDTRTKVERTPLHIAAYEGHTAVAELLLSHGAQPDSRDMLQMTPLHWAVEKGHAGCVRALLGAGAEPRAVSKFLRTPHSLAAAAGRADLLLLLEEAEQQREAERSAAPIQEPEVNLTEVEDDAVIEAAVEEVGEVEAGVEEAAAGADDESAQRAFAELLPQPPTECSSATAALLRRHGITMLPADNTSTVLSALRSGRTVVLSDAGKLMLKESKPMAAAAARSVPTPHKLPPAPSPAAASTPATPPTKLARIFTLNGNQVVSVPRGTKLANANNIIKLPHAKIVKASAATAAGGTLASRLGSARSAIIKLNQLKSLQKEGVLGAGGAGGGGVRIVMHRNTLGRLVSAGVAAPPPAPAPAPPPPPVGERLAAAAAAGGGAAAQLRAERDAARAALAEREREVRELRRRLLAYEPGTQ